MPCDAQARHVDVLCFTEADTDSAVLPVVHPTDASDTDSAVQPLAQPSESHGIEIDTDPAAPPVQSQSIADIKNEDEQQASKHLDDGGKVEALEDLNITALEATTSAHDDWLHRGKFL